MCRYPKSYGSRIDDINLLNKANEHGAQTDTFLKFIKEADSKRASAARQLDIAQSSGKMLNVRELVRFVTMA